MEKVQKKLVNSESISNKLKQASVRREAQLNDWQVKINAKVALKDRKREKISNGKKNLK